VGPELLDYTVTITVTATDSSAGIQDVFDAVSSQIAVNRETFYLQLDTNRFEVDPLLASATMDAAFPCALVGCPPLFSAKWTIDYNIKFNDIKFSLPEPGHVE
jgi:hypothetical protein